MLVSDKSLRKAAAVKQAGVCSIESVRGEQKRKGDGYGAKWGQTSRGVGSGRSEGKDSVFAARSLDNLLTLEQAMRSGSSRKARMLRRSSSQSDNREGRGISWSQIMVDSLCVDVF